MPFHPAQAVLYRDLSSKQQELWNQAELSWVLARFGWIVTRLSDDWAGADFLAQHVTGETAAVQLKGRLELATKYQNKGLYLAFKLLIDGQRRWFIGLHDEIRDHVGQVSNFMNTNSWIVDGEYSWPDPPPAQVLEVLDQFILPALQE